MSVGDSPLLQRSLSAPSGRANNFWHVRRDLDDVIVFIHGIFSSSLTCWLYQDGDRRVYWPDLIRGDARFGSASVYMAGYYTAIDAGDFSIAQCAREVLEALKTVDPDGSAPVMNARKLTLVCHSTGGIVARYLLDRYLAEFQQKAVGLALIASPSLGSAWADVAAFAARYYNQRLGQQLQWRGEALEDIHNRFKDLVNERAIRLPGLFGMEACENKMVFRKRLWWPIRMLIPARWKVVSTLSAGQYFGEVKVLPDTDHFSSVKPDTLSHPAHEFLVTFERQFERERERIGIAPRAAAAAMTAASPQPSDDLDAADWPITSITSTTFFLSAEDFESIGLAIACCVVIDEPATIEASLAAELDQWLRDPHVTAIPGVSNAVKRQALEYGALDPELRSRLVDWLGSQLFEAYVCFSRDPTTPNPRERVLEAVLQNRLSANRTRPVTVRINAAKPEELNRALTLIERVRARVSNTASGGAASAVSVDNSTRPSAGLTVSRLVAEIVQARLRANAEIERRPFLRVHPQKIRVIHDLDTGIRYTRRRPFAQ